MADDTLDLSFKETMAGYFALDESDCAAGADKGKASDTQLAMHAEIYIDDIDRFIDDPEHSGSLKGHIDFPPLGENIPAQHGAFNLFKPADDPLTTHMIYELTFTLEGQAYYLAGYKEVRDDPGFDLWSDTTTLYTKLYKGADKSGDVIGAGVLSLGMVQLASLVSTIRVPKAKNLAQRSEAVTKFGRFFMGRLWDSYAVNKFMGRKSAANTPTGDDIDFDVIVIGSGFGGAVTAARLAEKGMSVCILERGRRWDPKDYPRNPGDAWWWSSDEPQQHNGWIDVRFFDDMAIAQGSGVGGGSLIYANVFVEAKPFVFEEGWPDEISYDVLKPYYDRVGEMLNVQELPENQVTERTKLMKEGAESIGAGDRFRMLPLAVTFNQEWNYNLDDPFDEKHSNQFVNKQGITQGTCIHCGNCDIGCQVRAKNTLDVNYIPLAERHNADVRPLHIARKITPLTEGYRVHYDHIDSENQELIPGSLNARKVILAAGSLGSTELLLRCKEEYDTLPNVSDQLGVGWSSNGDFLTPALYKNRDKELKPTRGPTISSAIDFLDGSEDGERFFVEDGGFPDVLANALEDFSGASKFGLFMSALAEQAREHNLTDNIMPWFGQGIDASDGQLKLTRSWLPPFRKKIDLDWDIDASEKKVQALVDMHKKLSAATGGDDMVPPTWKYAKDLITPHPLGGCRMANSAAEGVVDHKGEVFGYPGLYVADSAIIPKAIGLNPTRTIAALAERIAEFIDPD